jgi:hypothetical protein
VLQDRQQALQNRQDMELVEQRQPEHVHQIAETGDLFRLFGQGRRRGRSSFFFIRPPLSSVPLFRKPSDVVLINWLRGVGYVGFFAFGDSDDFLDSPDYSDDNVC